MRAWKKALIAMTLSVGVAIPIGVYTTGGAAASPAGEQHMQHKWDQPERDHKTYRLRHALWMGTHRQMYLTLLAEKYTPESVEEWKAAIAERERLMEKWKAHKKAGKGVKPTEEDREAFRQFLQQFKQTHEEFDAAIESGDASKIKAVLPKLLKEVQTVNQHLANKLEQTKN